MPVLSRSLGLDQINLTLPRTFDGMGEVRIQLEVDGLMSNAASVTF
jgi:uncharacterized protein (TIGR03437 family)